MRSRNRPLAAGLAGLFLFAACGAGTSSPSPTGSSPGPATSSTPSAPPPGGAADSPTASGTLTIYAGRNEALVGPLIERFKTESGLDVQVNYAGSTDLAATILEEGDASPADVFFSQDAGALGAIGAQGRLAPLGASTLALVDERFSADAGDWIGVSARARVVAYDTRTVTPERLPASIDGFTDASWKGRIGWAPSNASLQSFVTAYRVLMGDEAATDWLEGIQANEPKVYDGNDAVLAAIAAGEVDVGFINHYYVMQQLEEQGESFPVRNYFLRGGDPGALVNLAGVGILSTAPNPVAAQAFVDFLLTPESQTYFAAETYEYPLIRGVAANPNLPPLADIESPDIDLSDLADLQGTQALMQAAGVL